MSMYSLIYIFIQQRSLLHFCFVFLDAMGYTKKEIVTRKTTTGFGLTTGKVGYSITEFWTANRVFMIS